MSAEWGVIGGVVCACRTAYVTPKESIVRVLFRVFMYSLRTVHNVLKNNFAFFFCVLRCAALSL